MIEFERTNEKGDKVKAYTHQSYLSHQFNSQITGLKSKYQTYSSVVLYGTTIATYWVYIHLRRQSTGSQSSTSSFRPSFQWRENSWLPLLLPDL